MTTTLAHPPLSQRLRGETAHEHERMHRLMALAQPFSSRERYASFLRAQLVFQRDVERLFELTRLLALVDDLEGRGRVQAALSDLADLGAAAPVEEPVATAAVGMPQALGWLYVSEGSTLGAAFLLKEAGEKLGLSAEFGARHLAAHPEGRARAWKRFVAMLDAPAVPADQQDAIIGGAMRAYARFGDLLAREFDLDPRAGA